MKQSQIEVGKTYVNGKGLRRTITSESGGQLNYAAYNKNGESEGTGTSSREAFAKWATKEYKERVKKEGLALNTPNAELKAAGLSSRKVRSIAKGLEYYLKAASATGIDIFVDSKGHGHLVHAASKPPVVKGEIQKDALIYDVGANFLQPSAK
jgi:hypothetical protein